MVSLKPVSALRSYEGESEPSYGALPKGSSDKVLLRDDLGVVVKVHGAGASSCGGGGWCGSSMNGFTSSGLEENAVPSALPSQSRREREIGDGRVAPHAIDASLPLPPNPRPRRESSSSFAFSISFVHPAGLLLLRTTSSHVVSSAAYAALSVLLNMMHPRCGLR